MSGRFGTYTSEIQLPSLDHLIFANRRVYFVGGLEQQLESARKATYHQIKLRTLPIFPGIYDLLHLNYWDSYLDAISVPIFCMLFLFQLPLPVALYPKLCSSRPFSNDFLLVFYFFQVLVIPIDFPLITGFAFLFLRLRFSITLCAVAVWNREKEISLFFYSLGV